MLLRPLTRSVRIAALVALAASCVQPVVTMAAASPVDVVAKNWSFTPAIVNAKVGEPTVLHLTTTEGVHGVESADIGLAKTIIAPGKMTEVTFTPKTAGTFVVHCAVVCGEGHDKMIMTVKVAP